MNLEIKGAKELQKKLAELSKQGAKRAARKAVNAGTTVLLKAIRANTPVDTGDLKQALTKKITKSRGGYNGIVGADKNFVGANGELPSHYDHLVEGGHKTEDGGTVPPRPFIRSGFDQSQRQALDTYSSKLATEIEAEALKGNG